MGICWGLANKCITHHSKELYIEREDFKEDASGNFFRLTIGKEVRLKNAYIIKADSVVKNDQGNIIEIKDDYMVGPLGAIYETEGYQERKQWWEGVLQNSPYTDQLSIVDDKLTVHQLLTTLEENPDEQVWLWMAQNAHDVCGYYWLMTQLKEYAGRIQVLI